MKNFYILFINLLLMSSIIINCSEEKKMGKLSREDSLLIDQYDTLNTNFWKDEGNITLYRSINSHKIWEIKGDTLLNNSIKGVILVKPFFMKQFDTLGNILIEINSGEGKYFEKKNILKAYYNVRLKFFDKNLSGNLICDSLILIDKKTLKAYNLNLKIFNNDTLQYIINSQYGEYYAESSDFYLEKFVEITYTEKKVKLLCDDLFYRKSKDIITSKGHVKFVKEDGTYIEGDGFKSDTKFNKWKIEKNISGTVMNVNLGDSL